MLFEPVWAPKGQVPTANILSRTLSRILIRPGSHIPGNMHFTTTRAHQELSGGTCHDVIIDEAHAPSSEHPFQGTVDLAELERLIHDIGPDRVPYVSVAATVNMAGGQPISLANLTHAHAHARAHDLARRHGVLVIQDAARAVENAWFIQQRDRDGAGTACPTSSEMCARADGATMSAEKDSYANIGAGRAPATRRNRCPRLPLGPNHIPHEPSEAAGAGAGAGARA